MNIDIENLIKSQLEEIDLQSVVTGVVREAIHKDLIKQIKEVTNKRITEIVNLEIEEAFSKGVSTDDGWGKKESYASFEELFKKEFYRRMNDNWDVKRSVQKYVEDKVSDLFRKNASDIASKVAKEFEVLIPK